MSIVEYDMTRLSSNQLESIEDLKKARWYLDHEIAKLEE